MDGNLTIQKLFQHFIKPIYTVSKNNNNTNSDNLFFKISKRLLMDLIHFPQTLNVTFLEFEPESLQQDQSLNITMYQIMSPQDELLLPV